MPNYSEEWKEQMSELNFRAHSYEMGRPLIVPDASDIENAGKAFEVREVFEEPMEPEQIEETQSMEEATRMSVQELMIDACGRELFCLEKTVTLHQLADKLKRLGYSRTVPYSPEGLLAAVQDGAYVLLYLPRYHLDDSDTPRLENGGSCACRVIRANEDSVVVKDHLSGAVKELPHETIVLQHPGAQVLEVYK